MAKSQNFRVGKVTVYLRGQVWYLRYHEQGKRHQVRASDDKTAARQLAAQVNAQLDEHVLRSSVATINRYRTVSDHLLNFVAQ